MLSTLTKVDIISSVQTEKGYSFKRSTEIVETMMEIIKTSLKSAEDFTISGFGKFQIREKEDERAEIRQRMKI